MRLYLTWRLLSALSVICLLSIICFKSALSYLHALNDVWMADSWMAASSMTAFWMNASWGLFLRWLLLGWLLLTLSLNKTPLGETGCLGNPLFLFTGCLGIQFFDSPPFSQQSQLHYLWLPIPYCAALLWLTRCHAIPLVTKSFPLNPYLGKQGISLGVASILSMCLCSHT